MSEPFLGQIQIWGGNFAPRGWAFCNGQLLPISQNTALFSLLGTTYGGDGRTNFGLPNLQSRVPMHPGHGPGLSTRRLGERGGADTVTLAAAETPSHGHTLIGSSDDNNSTSPVGGTFGLADSDDLYRSTADVDMKSDILSPVGGGQAHNNRQPMLALSFVIALDGVYPTRN